MREEEEGGRGGEGGGGREGGGGEGGRGREGEGGGEYIHVRVHTCNVHTGCHNIGGKTYVSNQSKVLLSPCN